MHPVKVRGRNEKNRWPLTYKVLGYIFALLHLSSVISGSLNRRGLTMTCWIVNLGALVPFAIECYKMKISATVSDVT